MRSQKKSSEATAGKLEKAVDLWCQRSIEMMGPRDVVLSGEMGSQITIGYLPNGVK